MSPLTRRELIGLGAATAAGAAGVAVAEATGLTTFREAGAEAAVTPGRPVPFGAHFYGAHQAGIGSPVQDRLHIATFDVTSGRREDVVALLRAWTAAAARMTQGQEAGPGGAIPSVPQSPPEDTGEVLGLPSSRLTLTFGLGSTLFEKHGTDRFGIKHLRPAGLIDLPHFPKDELDPARSNGDIVVQACADDPQVAVHAIRNLARIGFGTVSVRWSQLGFGKTSSTTPQAQTPRNMFGFKDGTNNISGNDDAAMRRHVWADAGDGASWMAGGTYLVARKIRMHIEIWDRTSLAEQESITGRHKGTGAPIGLARERDPFDVTKQPEESHVALAHADSNGGHRMLRRGYSFVDGSDGVGHLDAGLFFIAFIRDPRTQYVPVQSRLSGSDVMMEYLQHVGSGLYAVPPGVRPGGYLGQGLLDA